MTCHTGSEGSTQVAIPSVHPFEIEYLTTVTNVISSLHPDNNNGNNNNGNNNGNNNIETKTKQNQQQQQNHSVSESSAVAIFSVNI